MGLHDNTNITGVANLLNYSGDKNLQALETSIVNDITETNDVDDVEQYKMQLNELGTALGVNFQNEETESHHSDDDVSETASIPDVQAYQDSGVGFSKKYESDDIDNAYDNIAYRPRPQSYGARITEDQKKQKILNHALAGMDDEKFSVEKEKEEDDKAIMLEQIDMLMTNLKDEGLDISRVPHVDNRSPMDDISSVHKILRLKNDRNRYCSFAEECILAGSHTLEWMFDGEKNYMGRKPDVRGWSATVNIKLRRMKYETSTFVSEVMQDYNLGPGTRILLELVPSLFLYSKMRKSQHADNLITSDEMNAAIDTIRDIEEGSNSF
jgi:hypothetical protein